MCFNIDLHSFAHIFTESINYALTGVYRLGANLLVEQFLLTLPPLLLHVAPVLN